MARREYIACLELGGFCIKLGVSLYLTEANGVRQFLGNYVAAVPMGIGFNKGSIQNVYNLKASLKELFDAVQEWLKFPVEDVYVDGMGSKITPEKIWPSVECNVRFNQTQTTIVSKNEITCLERKVSDVQRKDVSEMFDFEALAYYTVNPNGKMEYVGSSDEEILGNVAPRCACLYNLYYRTVSDGAILTELLESVGVKRHKMRMALRGTVHYMMARADDRTSLQLLMNVGHDFTEFGYIKDRKLYQYHREQGLGAQTFTRQISEALSISMEEAERLKREVNNLGFERYETMTIEAMMKAQHQIDKTDRVEQAKMVIIFTLMRNFFPVIARILLEWYDKLSDNEKSVGASFYNATVGFVVHRLLITGGGISFQGASQVMKYIFNNKPVQSTNPVDGNEFIVYPYSAIDVQTGVLPMEYKILREVGGELLYNQSQYASIIGLRELAIAEAGYSTARLPEPSAPKAEPNEESAEEGNVLKKALTRLEKIFPRARKGETSSSQKDDDIC